MCALTMNDGTKYLIDGACPIDDRRELVAGGTVAAIGRKDPPSFCANYIKASLLGDDMASDDFFTNRQWIVLV